MKKLSNYITEFVKTGKIKNTPKTFEDIQINDMLYVYYGNAWEHRILDFKVTHVDPGRDSICFVGTYLADNSQDVFRVFFDSLDESETIWIDKSHLPGYLAINKTTLEKYLKENHLQIK